MTYTVDNYKTMSRRFREGQQVLRAEMHCYMYEGPIVAKERPRKGKNGKMFTPPATRKFEKAVADWGKSVNMTPVLYPIRVRLTIADPTDDPDLIEHSNAGLVYNMKRDLDNMAKSILDGLNGVAYSDDKQIVRLDVRREYAADSAFFLTIERAGLSPSEYSNFKKFL